MKECSKKGKQVNSRLKVSRQILMARLRGPRVLLPGRSQRGSPLRQGRKDRLSVPTVPGHSPKQRGVGADGAESAPVPGGREQLLPRGGAVEM